MAKFGEDIIKFCKKVPRNPNTNPLITQLVKAGTSVGANYCEADDAKRKKDFRHKIGIVKKESRESKHFIRMIAAAVPELKKSQTIVTRSKRIEFNFQLYLSQGNVIKENRNW